MKAFKTALAIFALSTAAVSGSAWAQPANHNPAMREACKTDMESLCAGVAPGQPTMMCMMKNRDNVSDGCKQAMAAMRGQGGGQMGGMSDQAKAAAKEKADDGMEKGKSMAEDKMKEKAKDKAKSDAKDKAKKMMGGNE